MSAETKVPAIKVRKGYHVRPFLTDLNCTIDIVKTAMCTPTRMSPIKHDNSLGLFTVPSSRHIELSATLAMFSDDASSATSHNTEKNEYIPITCPKYLYVSDRPRLGLLA